MFTLLPPATRALILINVGVFLLQQLAWNPMLQLFALWPPGSGNFQPWQLITYAFLHGNLVHIFFSICSPCSCSAAHWSCIGGAGAW
jgi:membrane associated rhomboid family serine protease